METTILWSTVGDDAYPLYIYEEGDESEEVVLVHDHTHRIPVEQLPSSLDREKLKELLGRPGIIDSDDVTVSHNRFIYVDVRICGLDPFTRRKQPYVFHDSKGVGHSMKKMLHSVNKDLEKLVEVLGVSGCIDHPIIVEEGFDYHARVKLPPDPSNSSVKPLAIALEQFGIVYLYDAKLSFYYGYSLEAAQQARSEELLPPQWPRAHLGHVKPTLVLNLDSTLVSSRRAGYPCGDDTCSSIYYQEQYNQFYVSTRPGVDEFVREMAGLYELVVVGDSKQRYVDVIIDKMFEGRRFFEHRLYIDRPRRDLKKLGRDLKRVVMLDLDKSFREADCRNMIVMDKYDPNMEEIEARGSDQFVAVSKVLRSLAATKGDVDFRRELERLREEGGLSEIEKD